METNPGRTKADDEPDVLIIVPRIPPSKNKYIGKIPAIQKRQFFEPWNDLVMRVALEARASGQPWPRISGPVDIEITFIFPNRRHPDIRNLDCFPPLVDILTKERVTRTRAGIRRKRGLGIIEDDRHGILHWRETKVRYEDCVPNTEIRIWRRKE